MDKVVGSGGGEGAYENSTWRAGTGKNKKTFRNISQQEKHKKATQKK